MIQEFLQEKELNINCDYTKKMLSNYTKYDKINNISKKERNIDKKL